MNILIGDIGNTVTKLCLVDNKSYKIKKIIYFDSYNILSKKKLSLNLKKIIKSKKLNRIALFSSVVTHYESVLKKFLKRFYKIKFVEIKEKKIVKSIKINIKNKNQVGSDRIANAVGVYEKYKKNYIVVDFGTATTFDVITKNGLYNGGVIAPGVNVSLKSLVKLADKLPSFKLKKQKKVIGKNTLDAMRSGFFWGYIGLINNIIIKIEKETNKKYNVLFTGGYAKLFKTSIIKPFKIDKNITINGIIEIFKKNTKYLN